MGVTHRARFMATVKARRSDCPDWRHGYGPCDCLGPRQREELLNAMARDREWSDYLAKTTPTYLPAYLNGDARVMGV